MLIRLFVLAWLCLCTMASQAAPATHLPIPTVAYSADRTMTTEAGTFTGKVHSSFGMERTEMNAAGMSSVMILRPDRDVAWMLMPAQRMYQELDFAKAQRQSGAGPSADVSITEVGSDTIDGHATTKYRLMMKDGSAGGFMWFTADGIAIKMDLLSKEDGRATRLTVTLSNLVVGELDAALFELPGDYSAMPGFKGLGGLTQAGNFNSTPAASPAPPAVDPASVPAQDLGASELVKGSVKEAAKQVFTKGLLRLPGLGNR
jgi:Domain of unknown function (DUF4412)